MIISIIIIRIIIIVIIINYKTNFQSMVVLHCFWALKMYVYRHINHSRFLMDIQIDIRKPNKKRNVLQRDTYTTYYCLNFLNHHIWSSAKPLISFSDMVITHLCFLHRINQHCIAAFGCNHFLGEVFATVARL